MAVQPRLICFDLGGVLVHIRRTWREAGDAVGVEGLPDRFVWESPSFELVQQGRLNDEEFPGALGAELGIDAADAARTHEAILADEYPGVAALAAAVRRSGLVTGCLSNTNGPHWHTMLHSGRFPTVAGLMCKMPSHLVRLQKPDQAIFERYACDFGVLPLEIVFFDDIQENVEAAILAGWRAFRVDASGDVTAQMSSALEPFMDVKGISR